MSRVCFVISPIGAKDSPVRKAADDVFDLIIEPAVERFGFEVVRADKLTLVASITSEVIKLVQHADLCIIDITGQNPNVMYECGRRHETGKPYLMIAQEGEKLPFDINSIRTIFYNCSNGREIRQTVKTMQSFIERMMAEGMEPEASGESLATLSDALRRIERQVAGLHARLGNVRPQAAPQRPETKVLVRELGHVGAFNYALTQRDADLAEALIPLLESRTDQEVFRHSVLAQASALGSRIANERLDTVLGDLDPTIESHREITSGYIQGATILDRERPALEALDHFFDAIESGRADLDAVDRAYLLNQKQKLLSGCNRYAEALEVEKRVVTLNPREPAYFFNLSLIYEALEQPTDAFEMIKRCIELGTELEEEPDSKHLTQAVDLYAKAGQTEEANALFAQLQRVNPYRAEVLLANDEFRERLGLSGQSA